MRLMIIITTLIAHNNGKRENEAVMRKIVKTMTEGIIMVMKMVRIEVLMMTKMKILLIALLFEKIYHQK